MTQSPVKIPMTYSIKCALGTIYFIIERTPEEHLKLKYGKFLKDVEEITKELKSLKMGIFHLTRRIDDYCIKNGIPIEGINHMDLDEKEYLKT